MLDADGDSPIPTKGSRPVFGSLKSPFISASSLASGGTPAFLDARHSLFTTDTFDLQRKLPLRHQFAGHEECQQE